MVTDIGVLVCVYNRYSVDLFGMDNDVLTMYVHVHRNGNSYVGGLSQRRTLVAIV